LSGAFAASLCYGEKSLSELCLIERQLQLDLPVFAICVAVVLSISVPVWEAPLAAASMLSRIYEWIEANLGFAFIWAAVGATIFLLWLALSRHGKRTLGGIDAKPEFSKFSWIGMLFCAGIGASIMYWSAHEWAFYVDQPPFGAEKGSIEAMEWASTYGLFHWGVPAWALYCVPAVTIGWVFCSQRTGQLRFSTSLTGLFGPGCTETLGGRLVDVFFIVGLIGGTGTSLGLATPMLTALIAELGWLPQGFTSSLLVLMVCTGIVAVSVYLGLDKGIRRLSEINAWLAIGFCAFVLITGPTAFLLNAATNNLGLLLDGTLRMMTWMQPFGGNGFVGDWTIFYWAWWIAYAPFVGLFVARISYGRTLREMVFGMLGYGTAGGALYYLTLGTSAMWHDMQGLVPILQAVRAGTPDIGVAAFIGSMPLNPLPLLVFLVTAVIFVATTYDSSSFAIASAATKNLEHDDQPPRWQRIFWAFGIMALPVTLLVIREAGGDALKAIQSLVLVVALPIMLICVLSCISLVKSLNEQGNQSPRSVK